MAADRQVTETSNGIKTSEVAKLQVFHDRFVVASSGGLTDTIIVGNGLRRGWQPFNHLPRMDAHHSWARQSLRGYHLLYDMLEQKLGLITEGIMCPYEVSGRFYAEGSGAAMALGAMAMNATAVEAVSVAIEHSIHCSGGPDWFDCREGHGRIGGDCVRIKG